jgi:hypothetical protein
MIIEKKTLVVARYKENVDWIKDINHGFIVYNKGENDISIPNIRVPNEGRESETYLRFILDFYYTLPSNMVFCQGNPFDHCVHFRELISQSYKEDLVHLAHYNPTDDENGFPNHCGLDIKSALSDLGLPNPGKFLFAAGAQYIVSRDLIQNKSYEWWDKLYRYHQNRPDAPWIYERIWPIIFNFSLSKNI